MYISTILATTLILGPAILGTWYSRRKQDTNNFLIGSHMSVASVAFSCCSSFISSSSLVGFPAEVYFYGAQFIFLLLGYFIAFPIVAFVFVPKIYNVKFTSIYECLSHRFGRTCHYIVNACFFVQTVVSTAVPLYVTSVAIAKMTGISLELTTTISSFAPAIFIAMGGARAGVYTSMGQMILVFISLSTIIVCSYNSIPDAFASTYKGNRLNVLDFRIDPTVRHSFLAIICGGVGTILYLFGANQISSQRYVAMKTENDAKKVVLLNIPFNSLILLLYTLIGILIYHKYHDCPLDIKNKNEAVPQYIIDTFSNTTYFYGIFLATLVNATISSMTAAYVSCTTLIIEGFKELYIRLKKQRLTDDHELFFSRIIPFLVAIPIGGLAYLLVFWNLLGLQIAFSIFGIIGGPVLGTVIIAFFIPVIKGWTGTVGLLSALIACSSLAIGSIYYQVAPISTPFAGNCNGSNTIVVIDDSFNRVQSRDGLFSDVSRTSYMYYILIGTLINISCSITCQFIQYLFNSKRESTDEIKQCDSVLVDKNSIEAEKLVNFTSQ